MTVTTTDRKVFAEGDGATTEFDFSFKYQNDSDINAEIDGVATSDFTITANEDSDGGTVTFTTAPEDGAQVLIYRELEYTQETRIPAQNKIPRGTLENAYDKATMLIQQLAEIVSRAPLQTLSDSELGTNLSLPTPSARKALLWNDDADGFENSTYDPDEVVEEAQASATEAAASATAAAASATAAATSATNAATAETNAETAQAAAEAAQAAAEAAQAAAETAETNAETAETNAELAETNAETAQAAAQAAQVLAESAEASALVAQAAAETAATNAQTAETNAETAETNAELAETNAELAETNAEAAQAAAEAAQAAAEAAQAAAEAAAGLLDTKGQLLTHDGAANQKLNVGTNGYVVKANSAVANGLEWGLVDTDSLEDGAVTGDKLDTELGVLGYICLRDEKTSGTDGGTFTSGAWRTRDINTEEVDTGGDCSLSSNQFTLTAGTYRFLISAPAYYVQNHVARLQNVTDGTTIMESTSEYAGDSTSVGAQTRAFIQGRFTIGASKALEVQHRCGVTKTTNGFGIGHNLQPNVYTVVELWRVA